MAGKALNKITLDDLTVALCRVYIDKMKADGSFAGHWIFADSADPHSADKAKGMVPLPPLKSEKPRPIFEVPLQALKTVPKDPLRG